MNRKRGIARALTFFALVGALSSSGCGNRADALSAIGNRVNHWTVPGVLRIETTSTPDTLNPLLGQESIDTDLSMFWAGHLFNWSDEGQMIPELATEVPTVANGGISADGRTIVYHLRRGVLWQDGKPFDARDVVFTWHAIMNPDNAVPVREGYDLITAIDTPDPYTLVVHLRRPYAPFISTFFAMSSTAYAVLPEHILSKYKSMNDVPFNRAPIGTGPFRVVALDNSGVKLVANRSYWRGLPQLNEVDFHWQPSGDKILADLKAHKIDFYYGAFGHQEPQLHGIPGTTIYLYPFNYFQDIGFNTASPVVSDRAVRQALAYAVDRSAIVSEDANGVNESADTDQPPFSWARDENVRRYGFDPAKARSLLDGAGWIVGPNGIRWKDGRELRIVLVSDGVAGSATTERIIQTDWRAVGVDVVVHNVSVTALDSSTAGGGIEATGRFDAVIEGWVNGVDPDDSTQFMCDMRPPAGWNVYRYCNPSLDEAERAELSTYDQKARRADFARIQNIIADDVPIIMLSFAQQQDVVNLDLKNYYPATAVTPFWNPWQLEI
jgi:peptide/nickel transport system substrate-binding protein